MDIPQVTIPATTLGWATITLAFVAALTVVVGTTRAMLDVDVSHARKRRLGAVLAIVVAWMILEIRWLIKPVILEYDDSYWSIWEIAVFVYFVFAIKQHNQEDTDRHAALVRRCPCAPPCATPTSSPPSPGAQPPA
jgi:hypothetical protein